MRKKTIVATVILTFVLGFAFAQAAFAAQPEKQSEDKRTTSHGPASKKAKAKSDVEQAHKVEICHNDRIISVARDALPGHGLADAGAATTEETSEESNSGAVRGPKTKKHTDTLASDTAITAEGEGVGEGGCQGGLAQLKDQPDQEAAEQEESKQALPEETSGASQEPGPEEQEDQQSPPEGTIDASREARQEEQEDQVEEEVETCDGESIELSEEEKITLDLHNETREEKGLEQLCVDPTLQKAARKHSADMVKKNYFAHNSRDGKTSGERLKDEGYVWRITGENIAWGSGSHSKPQSRFEAWMKSDGHKKNILEKNFEQVGVGVAKGDLKRGGEKLTVYTVDFANEKKENKK